MTTPSLFDNPASHAADPPTSAEAAANHAAAGRREGNARVVLALVAALPGRTAIELWAAADPLVQMTLKEPQEVRRRLVDLRAAGLVRRGPARECSVRRTRQVTWTAVGGQS